MVPAPVLPQQVYLPLLPSAVPLAVHDLSSSSDDSWTLTLDGNSTSKRAITVPGGGYNSDEQAQPWIQATDVSYQAVYTRSLLLPSPPDFSLRYILEIGRCSLLDCSISLTAQSASLVGALNHGGEIFLAPSPGGQAQLVGAHYGPLMPFGVDLTPFLVPQCVNYTLTVVSHPFSYFKGLVPSSFLYVEEYSHPSGGFASRTPAGISKFIQLAVYPSIRFVDLFVRPSVSGASLSLDISVRNDGQGEAEVDLAGVLSSWNSPGAAPWSYPAIPVQPLVLPAGYTVNTTVTVPWKLGPASYWWPNRPFSETYSPQLHWMNLSLTVHGQSSPVSTLTHRFGFVEWSEGPYYYLVNGVRVNHLSDATPEQGMSYYDAYSQTAFAEATGPGTGAQETWKRYMRVGMTSNRIHQSTPTEAMMRAADEVGFILKPESPTRGCPGYMPCVDTSPYFEQSVQELVRWCRNHASVFAYSVENESDGVVTSRLIDAAAAVDGTRPLTTEGSGGQPWFNGSITNAHAFNMLHYAVPPSDREYIHGVGECAWCVANGLESYASLALQGRLDDVAYYAGWDWINYWSNFLDGMNATRHAWTQVPCQGRDRVDGVDGWDSPVIDWVQRAFHPFTVIDRGALASNPIFNGTGWPYHVDSYSYASGGQVVRNVSLFYEVLRGDMAPWLPVKYSLRWTAKWDNPVNGTAVDSGVIGPYTVTPGFHEDFAVSFAVPSPGVQVTPRQLYIVLQSVDFSGATLYTEDRVFVLVQ